MRRRRAVALTIVVAVAATAAGVWVSLDHAGRAADGARNAAAAELFYGQTLRDTAGAAHAMSAHRGQVVVVNFWATWCVPCVKEIPAFSKVHAGHAGRVAFVGLGIDSPDAIAAFDARFKPSYPLLAAGASGTDLARAFGDDAAALPFTVVLGADGRVVASRLGQVDETTLERWLAPFVAPRVATNSPP